MTTTPTNSTVSAEHPASRDGLHSAAVSAASAREALDALDDYARMADVDAHGARRILERFIAQHSGVCGAPSADPVAAGRSQSELAALIAGELAGIDGFDAADEHGGLYELRWSGGTQPEPLGDAWSMDYLPKGERIADAIRRRIHSSRAAGMQRESE